MSRIGFFCFLGRGHLNPGAALARRLQSRDHDVSIFHLSIARAAVLSAGLRFVPLDHDESAQAPVPEWVDGADPSDTVRMVRMRAEHVLEAAPGVVKACNVDALVVDQLDLGAGTVADLLEIPFVTLGCAPLTFLSEESPPPYFHWKHVSNARARSRNRMGNALISRMISPVLESINTRRREWGLPAFRDINETLSDLAVITQLPKILDFPQPASMPRVVHAGPLRDDHPDRRVPFPWSRLGERPIIYASLGTIRNHIPWAFRIIAEACAGFDEQLVLSLGGGRLVPEGLGHLPGNPVVVHFAPQRELIRRTALTVCCGLNTCLDSLMCGVPIVTIPIAEDQPGVAARMEAAGVGISVPLKRLTVGRLRDAMRMVLDTRAFRDAARRVQSQLDGGRSLDVAAHAVEEAIERRSRIRS